MLDGKGTLEAEFQRCLMDAMDLIDRARLCAALTKPWILPREGHTHTEKLPEPYSSLGARGVSNLEGRLLLALFPPGMPFFRFRIASRFRFDPTVKPELLSAFADRLFANEMIVQSRLESNQYAGGNTHAQRAGFRTRMRAALSQVIVTGDALVEMRDDYTFVLHRRDNYITKRDSNGDVMYHITRQKVDPLTLTDEQLIAANLSPDDLMVKRPHERMMDLYTGVYWQPRSRRWTVTQEIAGKEIVSGEERVTQFFSIPYELPPEGHYGRGLIEQNLGDVRSLNELTERILDFAGLASKHLFAIDYSSQVLPEDLAQETGRIFQARVQGGMVQDVATLRADKLSDFQIVGSTREAVRKDLATVMLMEAETTPRGERVTAYQVERVAMELEGALGGVYAPLADACQVPLIERLLYQTKRDGLLQPMPLDTVEIEAVTGIAALSRESDHGRLLGLMQTISTLGPEAVSRINIGSVIDLMMRQVGIYEPGIIKSEEQVAAEREQAMQSQMTMMAGEQAAKAAGGIAVNAAANAQGTQ